MRHFNYTQKNKNALKFKNYYKSSIYLKELEYIQYVLYI